MRTKVLITILMMLKYTFYVIVAIFNSMNTTEWSSEIYLFPSLFTLFVTFIGLWPLLRLSWWLPHVVENAETV